MWRRSTLVTAGLLVVLASACSAEGTSPEASEVDPVERLERRVDDAPAVLLARVHAAYDQTVMRVTITRGVGRDDEHTYELVAGEGAWRVEMQTEAAGGEGDEPATLLAVDDEICFDQGFRPTMSAQVVMSSGYVDFDPQPWTCTPTGFGLNTLATHSFGREDPRWRIENLTTDPSAPYLLEVEQVDGEPLLHLRTTGVTYDGPLDPTRPDYDLWVDGDLLPVRMETDGLTWVFDYPADLDAELVAPGPEERGSYGYLLGPGPGAARMCLMAGYCPEQGELTWGDGRR